MKIPVCRPTIGENERRWILKALEENRISSTGGLVELFEERFAEKVGTKYCVAVNSGGSALYLALVALGIGKGDEVIVPDFTMIACANAVTWTGAKPVFVDVECDTGNIDPNLIEKKITKRTKAIMAVHLYGHPCDMEKILKIARKHKLYVIEDCAEAHGAVHLDLGKNVGEMGIVSCFSFYANKIITTGEGGAICTNRKDLAEDLRRLRGYYFSPRRHFDHKKIAMNLRMSSLEAAIGLGQLEKYELLIDGRQMNAAYYTHELQDIPYIKCPVQKDYALSVYWMYWIKVGRWRDKLMKFLEENGIETRTGFFPMHWQKPYKEPYHRYPVSNKLGKETLYLPSATDLTAKEKDYVIKKIREFFKLYAK